MFHTPSGRLRATLDNIHTAIADHTRCEKVRAPARPRGDSRGRGGGLQRRPRGIRARPEGADPRPLPSRTAASALLLGRTVGLVPDTGAFPPRRYGPETNSLNPGPPTERGGSTMTPTGGERVL